MTLVNFVGKVGSGKTLFATADAVNSGKQLYSNYTINHPKYHELMPEMLVDPSLNDAIILLDEAYAWLESRTSGKDINRYTSYILFQSRKKGLDFYLTDQLLSTIDLRFRDLMDYEIRCKAIPNYREPIGFQYRIVDIIERRVYTKFLSIEEASKYFGLYNSWQTISPIDDEMLVKISKSKTKILEQIDGIVDTLLNESAPKKLSRSVISDYCLRNGYPKSYVDMAFNALKARMARAVV